LVVLIGLPEDSLPKILPSALTTPLYLFKSMLDIAYKIIKSPSNRVIKSA